MLQAAYRNPSRWFPSIAFSSSIFPSHYLYHKSVCSCKDNNNNHQNNRFAHVIVDRSGSSAAGLHNTETIQKYLKQSLKQIPLNSNHRSSKPYNDDKFNNNSSGTNATNKIGVKQLKETDLDLTDEYLRSVSIPSYISPQELADLLNLNLHELVRDSINVFSWFPDHNTTMKQMRKTNYASIKGIVLNFNEAQQIAKLYRVKTNLKVITRDDLLKNALLHYENNNIANKTTDNIDSENNSFVVRAPIVSILGHRDHGKTTLLDKLRHGNTAKKEKFGITQETYAHTIELTNTLAAKENENNGNNNRNSKNISKEFVKQFSFLDTPGHHSFTDMRCTAAVVADMVLLLVAADEGLLAQTYESLSITKDFKVPVLVAITKIDSPNANITAIRKELKRIGIRLLEDNSTNININKKAEMIAVEISTKQNKNIDRLINALFNFSNSLNLISNESAIPVGFVIESWKESGRGIVIRIVLKQGKLQLNQYFITDFFSGRVRNIVDSNGKSLTSVGSGVIVEIMGSTGQPNPGAEFIVCTEQDAKWIENEKYNELCYFQQFRFNGMTKEEIMKQNQDLANSQSVDKTVKNAVEVNGNSNNTEDIQEQEEEAEDKEQKPTVRANSRRAISNRVKLLPEEIEEELAKSKVKLSKHQRKLKRETIKAQKSQEYEEKRQIKQLKEQKEEEEHNEAEMDEEAEEEGSGSGIIQKSVILKSYNLGTARMLEDSIEAINAPFIKQYENPLIDLIESTTGIITKADITMARANECPIYCFRVRKPGTEEFQVAKSTKVKIRNYQHFQDLLDDLANPQHTIPKNSPIYEEIIKTPLFDHELDAQLNPDITRITKKETAKQ